MLNVKRSAVRDTVELLVDRRAEDETISTKILDLVLESPIDNRRALAAHIILSGGLAKIKGIRRRVLEQIKEQLKEERFKKLQDLRVTYALLLSILSKAIFFELILTISVFNRGHAMSIELHKLAWWRDLRKR